MQRIRQKKHGSIRDFYAAAILTGCLTIFLCLLWVIHPDLIFGSTMDWNNQHIIFPDYFRSRFYQTGQLFPNFASAIGAGQIIQSDFFAFLPIAVCSDDRLHSMQ